VGATSPSTQDRAKRAVAAFNRGRHDEARLLCEEGLKREPREPTLNHLLAAFLFAKGEVATARVHIEASLAVRPDSAPARLLAGRIARAAQDFDAALLHLDRAIALAPSIEAMIERARTLEATSRRAAAQEGWRTVLRLDPSQREAAARLGRLLRENGELAAALSLLEKAVAGEAPASAWFDLGMVRQDLNDLEGAARAYRTALEKRPDHAEAAVNLGVVLQDGGNVDAAMEAYRTAYRLRASTFGTIATALTSAPHGRMWIDAGTLKRLLGR
jgi:tetratricopeptide (TPR) repeat protein